MLSSLNTTRTNAQPAVDVDMFVMFVLRADYS